MKKLVPLVLILNCSLHNGAHAGGLPPDRAPASVPRELEGRPLCGYLERSPERPVAFYGDCRIERDQIVVGPGGVVAVVQ